MVVSALMTREPADRGRARARARDQIRARAGDRPARRRRRSAARSRAAWSRSTSAVKTSSNESRSSRALATSPPRAWIASTTSGVAGPASSTMTVRCRGPVWRTPRTNGRSSRSAAVEQRGGLDPDDVAARRLAPQVVRGRQGEQAATRDQRHEVARLGLVDVLGRDQHRPSGRAQPVELLPDARPQQRVDPGRRLVEEQQGGIVDERARELETALHAAGQTPGSPAPDVPQVEELEDLAGPAPPAREHHPEQRPHEVDVLADRQVRVERERLGHVAEPLAGLAPEPARLLAQHPDRAGCRGQGPRQKPDGRRLARARRSDQAEDRPGGDDQRDAVDGELVVEPHRDVVDDDRGVGRGRRRARRCPGSAASPHRSRRPAEGRPRYRVGSWKALGLPLVTARPAVAGRAWGASGCARTRAETPVIAGVSQRRRRGLPGSHRGAVDAARSCLVATVMTPSSEPARPR